MKSITINTLQLKKAIATFFSLKCESSVLPILEYMKVVCFPEQYISIRATDLVIDCKHTIDCMVNVGIDSFIFLAPFKKVYQALKYIETEEIELQITDVDLIIISEDIRVSIRLDQDYLQFPKCQVPDDKSKGYIIASNTFVHLFKTASLFASKDELRHSMMAVNLTKCDSMYDFGETYLYFVATDAHMLLFKNSRITYCGYDMMIPAEAAKAITTCFKDIEPLVIFKRDNLAVIHGNTCKIAIRLVDEKYPDWESILPKDDAFSLYVKRKQVAPKIRLCQQFCNTTTKQTIFTIGKEKMKIETENIEIQNSVSTSVPVFNSNQDADVFKVGFNADLFIKAISTMPDELIRITHSQAPNRASVINSEVLIMPIQLGSYKYDEL